MLLQNIDHNEMQQILTQLDQALDNHRQWHNDLMRTLACRLPYDKHDIAPDSFRECRFGQWYYGKNSKELTTHPGFAAIGEAHQRMHKLATQILLTIESHSALSPLDYDSFANSLEHLRLEIYTLKHELEILLYNRDSLTMAINRVTMLPILREQQDLMHRKLQLSCIAMMDLDRFKLVNDQYGHAAGDKVLAAISSYLIKHLRSYDKIFRYGGEEFLICLQDVDIKKSYQILEKFRKNIAKMKINVGLEKPVSVTVSFGLTMIETNFTVEEIIDQADKTLYKAKSSGRNRTEIWVADKT